MSVHRRSLRDPSPTAHEAIEPNRFTGSAERPRPVAAVQGPSRVEKACDHRILADRL